ncbi:hypothetical protein [Streptomyces sp. NPDC002853]
MEAFLAARDQDELSQPFTFVIDMSHTLLLAPRRSEHVACAGGNTVLAAGEMGFTRSSGRWSATYISNQSTGYCPGNASWPTVESCLGHVGIYCGTGFTHPITFRHCSACREWNTVKDCHFVCVFCDGDLSREELPR